MNLERKAQLSDPKGRISCSDWLEILRDIGLALHACNNCVTTDRGEVSHGSWRIDNRKEIALVHALEERFKDIGICPECGHCRTDHEMKRGENH